MLALGEVDAAEVAFGEHDPFGAQPTQVVVAKVVAYVLLIDPDPIGGSHLAELRLVSAYSVIAISASRVESR